MGLRLNEYGGLIFDLFVMKRGAEAEEEAREEQREEMEREMAAARRG